MKEEGSLGLGMFGEEDEYGLGPADRVLTEEEVEGLKKTSDNNYVIIEIKSRGKYGREVFATKACTKI